MSLSQNHLRDLEHKWNPPHRMCRTAGGQKRLGSGCWCLAFPPIEPSSGAATILVVVPTSMMMMMMVDTLYS